MHRRTAIVTAWLAVGLVACGGAGSSPDGAVATSGPASSIAATATGDAAPAATEPAIDDTTGPDVSPAPARTMTVSASGDILPHSPLWRQAANDAGGGGYDFGPMFARVEPRIAAADLAICHLETPIAPEGEDLSTDPLYGVPAGIADAIAGAGFDRCSTASNHAFDRGAAGMDRTVEVLESVGVAQSGMARTEQEAAVQPFETNGIAVVHLSYSYDFNGNTIPRDERWRAKWIDPDRIVFDAIVARQQGAEVVIVSLHWGTESETEPDAEQRRVAEAITASGEIDLVIGHHAHVLQPIEQVNGIWVAFGLGNILSNHPVAEQWPPSTQDAAIVEFGITVTSGQSGEQGERVVQVAPPVVRPTWVDKDNGWVIRDVVAELGDAGLGDGRRALLEASLERTVAVVGDFVITADQL